MDLGKYVLDKELVDRGMRRCGRVDDLSITIGDRRADGTLPEPEVVAIVTGPMALCQYVSAPVRSLARWVYRLLGLADPQPVVISWSKVSAIDVVVHVDIERGDHGMTALEDAVSRRYIGRLPGA